ncbi:hypothetical protein Hanom_Chr15g01345391 [Helianthus anomalus]
MQKRKKSDFEFLRFYLFDHYCYMYMVTDENCSTTTTTQFIFLNMLLRLNHYITGGLSFSSLTP